MASNLVPALSEGTFPSFPVHQPYFFERELCGISITSFGTSVAALKSICTLPSNSTPSDHHIYNNAKLSSGLYDTEQFDSETLLPSRYPTFKGNSSSLMMIVPKASEPISWNQETLQGLIDYPIGIYFSNQQDVNPVGKQIQDSITMDLNTQTAKENEWFSSGRSVQFLGSAVSVLKDIDARSLTPQNYSYCQVRSVSPFNYDEVSTDTLPSNTTPIKLRMRWTPELHEQFVEAINMLGGSEKATPKAIQRVMKVKGLTIYHVKSHLQKYRAIQHRPESSDGSSLTDEVPLPQLREMIFTYTDHVLTYFVNSRGWASADAPTGLKNVEGLRTQIGLQKQLYEQLEIQRKLQLQVEEHSKYLEMIIAKQSESLKKFGALPGCQDRSQPVLDDTKACEERTICASNSESRN